MARGSKEAYPSRQKPSYRLDEGRENLEGYAMAQRYQNRARRTTTSMGGEPTAASVGALVRSSLEDLVRAGAREMLRRALEEEVEAFLGRGRYQRRTSVPRLPGGAVAPAVGAIGSRLPRGFREE